MVRRGESGSGACVTWWRGWREGRQGSDGYGESWMGALGIVDSSVGEDSLPVMLQNTPPPEPPAPPGPRLSFTEELKLDRPKALDDFVRAIFKKPLAEETVLAVRDGARDPTGEAFDVGVEFREQLAAGREHAHARRHAWAGTRDDFRQRRAGHVTDRHGYTAAETWVVGEKPTLVRPGSGEQTDVRSAAGRHHDVVRPRGRREHDGGAE